MVPSSSAPLEGLLNHPVSTPIPSLQPPNPTETPLFPAPLGASVNADLSPGMEAVSPLKNSVHRSWKQALFPKEIPKMKFKLRYIPPAAHDAKRFGVCSMEAVKGELAVLDYTLVGFFLGKRPSFSFVKNSLLRQWKIHGNVEILQLPQGGYAFWFSNLEDRDTILDGDVFFVGGQPMFIRQWDRSLHTGGVLGLRKVPLWINLPGLPLHLWGEDSLSAICSVLGTPLYSDRTTAMKTRLMFARVCVEFSGDSPMLESILIEDEIGMKYEQRVDYEWKPPQCIKCGVFGHNLCAVEESDAGKSLKPNDLADPVECFPDAVTPPIPPISNPTVAEKEMPSSCSSGEEMGLDDGWQVFRARKKKPSGSGSPPRPKTRAQTHLAKGISVGNADGGSVSNPHWMKAGLGTSDQVCQPSLTPLMENFSKYKAGHGKDICTPTILENAKIGMDSNGPRPAIGVHLRQKSLKFRAPPPSSSAGHTPFPSRLSLMARDLRLGKMGSGSKARPKTVDGTDVLSAGLGGLGGAEQAHKTTPLGSMGWAVAGCAGPGLHMEEQAINDIKRTAIKSTLARDVVRPEAKGPNLNSATPLDQIQKNGSPSGALASPSQQGTISNSMGSVEFATQRTNDERLNSDFGYQADLGSERV